MKNDMTPEPPYPHPKKQKSKHATKIKQVGQVQAPSMQSNCHNSHIANVSAKTTEQVMSQTSALSLVDRNKHVLLAGRLALV